MSAPGPDGAASAANRDAAASSAVSTGPTAEEIAQLENMTREELARYLRGLEQETASLKLAEKRNREEGKRLQMTIDENKKRIKHYNRLPYLVANVSEIIETEPENEDEADVAVMSSAAAAATVAARERGASAAAVERELAKLKPKKTKSAVVKTTNRQTVFLQAIGLVDAEELKPEDLVGVNKDTFLVMDKLPTEYDTRVKAMEVDEKPKDKYTDIGGLDKQIREMMEAIVLPITNKEQYKSIGITAPKGVLLYGAPGVGKTMLARACAASTDACFLKLAGPQLVQMYIGEGARILRDAFALAKKKAPAIIFIDEIDAIGMRRGNDDEKNGSREVQRTMLELLSQLDGFNSSEDVKVIAATNRIDVLDPALLRSGRLDRKVEFPLPDEEARAQILEIHARRMTLDPDVNFEELARSTEEMNGAQLKACTVEAGMLALKHNRMKISHEDFVEGVSAVQAKKKSSLNYFA